MKIESILCVSLAAICFVLGKDQKAEEDERPEGDGNYEFGYDIYDPVSNDIKSHHEIRDGENVLGFYTFKEADGSIRVVKYKAGPTSGFEAIVEKIKPVHSVGNAIDEGEEASTKNEDIEQQPHNDAETQIYQDAQGGHRSPYVAGLLGSLLQSQQNVNNKNNQEQYDQEEEDAVKEVKVPKKKYKPAGKKIQNGVQNPYIIKHKHKSASTGQTNTYVAPNNNNPAVVRIHQKTNIPDGGQRNQHIVYRVHQGQGHIYGGDPGQTGIINHGQVYLVGGAPTAENRDAEASNEDENYEIDEEFVDNGFEPYEDDSDHENFDDGDEFHDEDENDQKNKEQ